MVDMRGPWRFYLHVAGIALLGVGLGYVVGVGKWGFAPLWATGLVIEIARFGWRYGPGRGGGETMHKRREDAEREYQRREWSR
jgi:hypothetical protein